MSDLRNRIGSWFAKPLLRSPLHGLISQNIMLITFTGRKSNLEYTTPVQYMRVGNTITFFTYKERTWWKNLQNDASVTVHIQGHNLPGTTTTFTIEDDEELILNAMVSLYRRMNYEQIRVLAPKLVMVQVHLGEESSTTRASGLAT